MSNPKVFAIVLNYNGKDTIRKCLDSLFFSDYPNLETVMVDNNSEDGSLGEMRRRFPRNHFIKNSENLGFSAGNNVGIRFALEKSADYIFLLNNDAWVEKDTISNLINFSLKHPKAGIISPLILKKDGSTWFLGGKIDWKKMQAYHKDGHKDYVTGCAMLIKKDVFKKIGLFDEDFFLYYEDADFCVRARKTGFDIEIDKKSAAHHEEKSEVSNPDKVYWLVLSGLIFLKKNTPRRWRPWFHIHFFLRKLKNKRDIKKGINKKETLKVQQAYQDSKLF